jgi:hypothetical protein
VKHGHTISLHKQNKLECSLSCSSYTWQVAYSTMRKWIFRNGCEFKCLISIAMEFKLMPTCDKCIYVLGFCVEKLMMLHQNK